MYMYQIQLKIGIIDNKREKRIEKGKKIKMRKKEKTKQKKIILNNYKLSNFLSLFISSFGTKKIKIKVN